MKLRARDLPLSAVSVTLYYLPDVCVQQSHHMRQNAYCRNLK